MGFNRGGVILHKKALGVDFHKEVPLKIHYDIKHDEDKDGIEDHEKVSKVMWTSDYPFVVYARSAHEVCIIDLSKLKSSQKVLSIYPYRIESFV